MKNDIKDSTEGGVKDPTEEGVVGLKGVRGEDLIRDSLQKDKEARLKELDKKSEALYDAANHYTERLNYLANNASPIENVGFVGMGDSKYDKDLNYRAQFENLEESRAQAQPALDKAANGLAKGAILAGTTFITGTLGLATGLVELGAKATANAAMDALGTNKDSKKYTTEDVLSSLWDNPVNKGMYDINNKSEEALQNRYTKEENEGPWYNHMATTNFIFDKVIKNLGFSVGALMSGGAISSALNVAKLPSLIGKAIGSTAAPRMITTATGATTSAMSEASVEAIQEYSDWLNTNKLKELKRHDSVLSTLNDDNDPKGIRRDLENTNYKEKIKELETTGKTVGNMDYLLNMPILLASNIYQFTSYYTRGFNTARKINSITKQAGKYASNKSVLGGVASAAGNAATEGTEELLQRVASTGAGYYGDDTMDSYYAQEINPDGEEKTTSWIKSLAKSANDTVNDSSAWEEFFIGALTGTMGIPTFRSVKSKSGEFQSPITMNGGFYHEYKDYMEKKEREDEIVDYLNTRVQDPKFKSFYRGLIAHNKAELDMEKAAAEDNKFEFKNAEYAQLLSDIIMFDNAGKLEDLKTLLDATDDTSDENLKAIIEGTTSTVKDEKGESISVGPYVDKKGNPVTATEEGKKSMIETLNKNREDIKEAIDNYVKIKDDIDIETGGALSNDQLVELAWYKNRIGNNKKRGLQLSKSLKKSIGERIKVLEGYLDAYKLKLGGKEADRNHKINDIKVSEIEDTLGFLKGISSKSDDQFYEMITNDFIASNLVLQITNVAFKQAKSKDLKAIESKIKDLYNIAKKSDDYNKKYNEFIANPGEIEKQNKKVEEKIKKKQKTKKSRTFKDNLLKATTLQDFRDIVNNEEDSDSKDEVLLQLASENNKLAKDYDETNTYNTEIIKAIDDSDEDANTKADAVKLFKNHFNNSSNLEQASYPNSVFLSDDTVTHDDELNADDNIEKFYNAQYAVAQAMHKVNNGTKYKNRFTAEYKVLRSKGNPNPKSPNKDITGDSGTPTIPSTGNNLFTDSFHTTIPEAFIVAKNHNFSSIQDENNQLSQHSDSKLPKSSGGNKKYYRPAIPELHIEAAKDGDFRPFKVVVKEREKGINFDIIYDFLDKEGAFDYVNDGKLHKGDTIHFVINKEFEDSVENESWHTTPTIFLATDKNQIVGSLDSGRSVDTYEGLRVLTDTIINEYNKTKSTSGSDEKESGSNLFIATPITKVSKLMIGKIPYTDTEISLKKFKDENPDSQFKFGMVKNGVLFTNDAISDKLVIKPMDMSNSEGRLYLLVPNGAGTYSPVAIRAKYFNKELLESEDFDIKNTPLYKALNSAITKLARVESEHDLSDALNELKKYLYIDTNPSTRTLHIDFIDSNKGKGIRFTEVERDENSGDEIYLENKEGEKIRQEKSKAVYFTKFLAKSTNPNKEPTLEDEDESKITEKLLNTIADLNLPIQVNSGNLNVKGYNNMLINSGVLTSNIREARSIGNWFITDYIDNEGKIQKADSPKNRTSNPAYFSRKSTEGSDNKLSFEGTTISGITSDIYIDTNTGTIKNEDDEDITSQFSPEEITRVRELAWAQFTYGESTHADRMIDNKVLTPTNRILDRNTGEYLPDNEATVIRNKINNIPTTTPTKQHIIKVNNEEANRVISAISANQKNVNKEKTDGDYYYILEDDGKYHPYKRVHNVLGSNWKESEKTASKIKEIKNYLNRSSSNPKQYADYVTRLSNEFKLDFNAYKDKTDTKSRNELLIVIRDKLTGTNSKRALSAGTSIDVIIRDFFNEDKVQKPDNISQEAFNTLITTLNKIKEGIKDRGETFLTNNIVLYHKYSEDNRVAGEVDILSVTKDGKFKIYDVKTSKYSFYPFTNKYGHPSDYFNNRSSMQNMSTKDYYTLQLNAYAHLFKAQYNTPIIELGVLPFVLQYSGNTVSSVNKERGIHINPTDKIATYLVPSSSAEKSTEPTTKTTTNSTEESEDTSDLPIFNSRGENMNPIEDLGTEFGIENSKIGFYIDSKSKVHKTYLDYIEKVNGYQLHMAKVPHMTNTGGKRHVALVDFIVVFPNGISLPIINGANLDKTDQEAKDAILNIIKGNPERVVGESTKNTVLIPQSSTSSPKVDTPIEPTKEESVEIESTKEEPIKEELPEIEPIEIESTEEDSAANRAISIEEEVDSIDPDYDAPPDIFNLRKVDSNDRELWNKEKELEWLNKVLPQLSREDRVKVVKGLIKVGKHGAKAWGKFNNGIITLSDIAAEGTTYHEAFHVVFNLLLDKEERNLLYNEARSIHGNLSDLDLEENMAEGFREYVMTKDNQGLGHRILNFFRELFTKISNWKAFSPHLTAYYRMIDDGNFRDRELNDIDNNYLNNTLSTKSIHTEFKSMDENIQNHLINKGWTEEKFNSISQEERDQAIKCIEF